jgi:hypothetical protein
MWLTPLVDDCQSTYLTKLKKKKETPHVNVKTKVAGNVPHDKLIGNMTLSEETDLTKLRKRSVGKIFLLSALLSS